MSFVVKECFDFGKGFWHDQPFKRGKLIDVLRNQNIPHNSKAIDRTESLDSIISHKSTNLLNKSYENPSTIYRLGLRFVKQLKMYKVEIRRNNIIGATYHLHWATDNPDCKRILEWFIPDTEISKAKTEAIKKVIEEAELQNIKIDIYAVRNY